jgi:hypothetical protein
MKAHHLNSPPIVIWDIRWGFQFYDDIAHVKASFTTNVRCKDFITAFDLLEVHTFHFVVAFI